jgi:hypothetical protein
MVGVNNITRFLVLSFLMVTILFIISYQITLIDNRYYVEPAENEALVLAQSKAFASGSQELEAFVKEGVLPIYPDLLHKVSLWGDGNKLGNLRKVSVISFWVTSMVLFIYAIKFTGSVTISGLLTLLFYGVAQHSLYFTMARPDGFYVAFGALCLVCLGTWFHIKPTNNFISLTTIAITGVLSGLALLSKQSGLFFVVVVTFCLLSDLVYWGKRTNLFSIIFFAVSLFATLFSYFAISPISFVFFLNGLTLYASDFSLPHVYKQLIDVFTCYWWLVLVTTLLFVDLIFSKRFKEFYFWISIWVLVAIMSVKLFSNNAAHFNNYIYITASFFFMATWLWRGFNFQNISSAILLLGFISSFYTFEVGPERTGLAAIHGSYKSRMLSNMPIEESPIFNYLRENDGQYLSGRADFMLYFSDREVIYEASVLDAYYYQGRQAGSRDISNMLAEKRAEINQKIKAQSFDGIILGINNETINNFPLINERYMKAEEQAIESGDWPHKIELWVPKIN